jgi:hypothetical protein
MISTWILPAPPLTRFITDMDGRLHIEAPTGGEKALIAYLREQLNAWEEHVGKQPIPQMANDRLMRQGHAGRPVDPGPVQGDPGVRAQYPLGTFSGGTGPVPTAHGPTPPYGPPNAAHMPGQPAGQPFVNPNAPPPPGFAYGVVPPGGVQPQGQAPNMLAYGWGARGAPPAVDPGIPGAGAMAQVQSQPQATYPGQAPGVPVPGAPLTPQAVPGAVNPIPPVCDGCHRLMVACDAQNNLCPQGEARARARAAAAAPTAPEPAAAQVAPTEPAPPAASVPAPVAPAVPAAPPAAE